MIAPIIVIKIIAYTAFKVKKTKSKQELVKKKEENIFQTIRRNSAIVFSKERREKMAKMAGNRYEVKSAAEKRVDRALVLSKFNLVAVIASYFIPPLIYIVIPLILYSNIPTFERSLQVLYKERRISSYLLNATLAIGAVAAGFYFTIIIGTWLTLISLKMIHQTEHSAKRNLQNLFGEQVSFVWILTEEEVELEIPFKALKVGDTIIVSAGQTIPIDGTIQKGFATIDQHKLTGESQPVEQGTGDPVLASTIVLSGKIYVLVEKTGEETVAMQIGKLLSQTDDYKEYMQAKGTLIADRAVIITAGMFLVTWPILGINSGLAVLSNKYGGKMQELSPASMLVFLNLASEEGILIKDGRSLELFTEIDTVVFDKTGTLTVEQPIIYQVHTYHHHSEDEILKYAAIAEQGQNHPVAKAILQAANDKNIAILSSVEYSKYDIGYGIQVELDDKVVHVGNHKFMLLEDVIMMPEIEHIQHAAVEQGHSLVYIAFDKELVGIIELQAKIRPEAKEVVSYLQQRNIDIYIISGDHEAPTKQLADSLGIKNYFANTLPENKADLVEQLREEGKSICFIGDGINDTIALKKANVSVSLHGATTVATDTAQVILMDGSLKNFPKLFKISEDFNKNMLNNFRITTIPTIIGLFGIFFFRWGFFTAMVLSQISRFTGIANCMLPILLRKEPPE